MKYKILNNIQFMRKDEIERLKIELFKPFTEKELNRFYSFVNIMDKTRNVKIGDYLPEWEPYFKKVI